MIKYVPKVGDLCEIYSEAFGTKKVLILFIGTQRFMCISEGKEKSWALVSVEFRPIKTEREKFVEALVLAGACQQIARGIFDTGLVQLKENQDD
jgi:hypothetical protein